MKAAWITTALLALHSLSAARDWTQPTLAERAAEAAGRSPWESAFWIGLGLAGTLAAMTLLGLSLVYAERKIAARFQCRLGPTRVGWRGTLQTLADTFKLISKADLVPRDADRLLFFTAPWLVVSGMLLALVNIPASPLLFVVDLNIGLLFISAVGALSVLGILLGGWASNNKWSLLGSMRAGAQIISYELSLTLSLLVIVLFTGSLSLGEIVQSQQEGWWLWRGHLPAMVAFLVFVIASTAELNRTPFDLAEGESELTAGFHTEYSGLRFALFYLAEFLNMFIAAGLAATLFLGGWMPLHIAGLQTFNRVMDFIPPLVWFGLKTGGLIFVFMWLRWTFPRLRIDQLLKLEWRFLLPLSMVNLLVAALVLLLGVYGKGGPA